MVSGAPSAHDIRGGRRTGNFADYQKLIKLGQSFNVLHFFGNQTLAPNDLPVNTRHLDATFANLTLTDKIFMSMSIGPGRVRDAVALTAIARGMTVSAMADDPSSITNININSPRKFDIEMADAAIAMAEMGQAVARNRIRWFGRRQACWVPTPELRARFLDMDARLASSASGEQAPPAG